LLKLKLFETKFRNKNSKKKILLKEINGNKKFGEPKFKKKVFIIFYRVENNDTSDLSPPKILIFKLFLFKTIFIAVTVFDVKLNFSRKSKTFETAITKITVQIKNEKIDLINCVDYKAGI